MKDTNSPQSSAALKPATKIPCEINGQSTLVPKGSTVIQAFKALDQDISHYCWHPGLSVAGVCRLCLVEIDGGGKLQIACNTEVKQGMKISNQTKKVKEAVRWGLEYHLINHPLDCPICDQAGECALQDQYMKFASYDSSMSSAKVKKRKVVDLGPEIVLDTERCILCSRCVRFTDEVSKTHELGIFNRGDKSEIGTFKDRALDNNYSLNTVDICPVGALTSKDFRFKQRVWYLKTKESICTGCSTACNIYVDYNEEGLWRVRPRFNEKINGHWMCDQGRYLYKNSNRKSRLLTALRGTEGQIGDQIGNQAGNQTVDQIGDQAKIGVEKGTKKMTGIEAEKRTEHQTEDQKGDRTKNQTKDQTGAETENRTTEEGAAAKPWWSFVPTAFILSEIQEFLKDTSSSDWDFVLTAQYSNEEYQALLDFFPKGNFYLWLNNETSFNVYDGLLLRGDRNPNSKGLRAVFPQSKAFDLLQKKLSAKKDPAISPINLCVLGPENPQFYLILRRNQPFLLRPTG